MKVYSCGNCGNLLYFENNICLQCQHAIGFDDKKLYLLTLKPNNDNTYSDINTPGSSYRYCQNSTHSTCNWLVPSGHSSNFCTACELNRTIPDLSQNENLKKWKRIEAAKHRLVYSLLKFRLPLSSNGQNNSIPLVFDFMESKDQHNKVMTGHDNGLITLNIEEADEAERVQHKVELHEKYRTLLGHLRHEVGHYYWDVLIKDSNQLSEYRKLFGDESQDYSKALEVHYAQGAPADWSNNYISEYASAHPWEDWAETWAHYLHLMDTLETAHVFGITVNPQDVINKKELKADIENDPYYIKDFDKVLKLWLPLTFALNSLNRSMGHQDFYPFIIPPAVTKKLKFIHEVCGVNRF